MGQWVVDYGGRRLGLGGGGEDGEVGVVDLRELAQGQGLTPRPTNGIARPAVLLDRQSLNPAKAELYGVSSRE